VRPGQVIPDEMVVIVWCPTCQTETMPRDLDGVCMFCDTSLVARIPDFGELKTQEAAA
jgi:hypothetical protein